MQDLRVQVATKSDGDDQIMLAVNSRIEEWKVHMTYTLDSALPAVFLYFSITTGRLTILF